MQIVTYATSKNLLMEPLPHQVFFCTLWFSKATLNVYKNIEYKMAHVSFWQLELRRFTAMLTPLPYNSLKSYYANTKLNLFLYFLFMDILIELKALN